MRMQLFASACVAALLAGCSRNAEIEDTRAEGQTIGKIAAAYAQANAALGKPPQTIDDLKPYIREGNPDDILRSPDDGEPYVIIWGVDVRQANSEMILAYEKTGSGGRRFVVNNFGQVSSLSDEEFRKATFPPGHQP